MTRAHNFVVNHATSDYSIATQSVLLAVDPDAIYVRSVAART